MCDIITLSSEDEDLSPPKKRIKPTLLDKLNTHIKITRVDKKKMRSQLENEVHEVLSDDDDEIRIINTKDDRVDEAKRNKSDTIDVKDIVEVGDDIDDTCEIVNESSDEQNSGKEESLDKENKSENCTKKVTDDSSMPSTSSYNCKPSNTVLLEKFVSVCEGSLKNSKYQQLYDNFPVLWKYYGTCETELGESTNFKQMITLNIENAQKSTALAVISFEEIFSHLKELAETETIEVSSENLIKLKKLKKTIKKLLAHINKLEETEVDFSDDENSVYMQLDRYNIRLTKVYQKYCELLNKNPYSGRLTHTKLDFVDSEYNEINRAISKKFKNNKKFPSYVEMETFIKKVVEDHNLELGQAKVKSESVHCFKKLGELLQHRRRRELYDCHYMHIKNSDDPAKNDPNLNSILSKSFEQGQKEIEKIVQSYVFKDQQVEKTNSTENESDKSDYVDSENEENENGKDEDKQNNVDEFDSE